MRSKSIPPLAPCLSCGSTNYNGAAKGLCKRCYLAAYKAAHKGAERPLCADCGAKPAHAGGVCPSCYGKRYRAEHYETERVRLAAYATEHRDENKAYQAKRYRDNPAEHAARMKAWRQDPATYETRRALWIEHAARRRELIRKAKPRGARVDVQAIYLRDRAICHVCHKRVEPGDVTLDHLVPLSRGGAHEPANIAIAHGRCNSRRHNSGPAQLRLLG